MSKTANIQIRVYNNNIENAISRFKKAYYNEEIREDLTAHRFFMNEREKAKFKRRRRLKHR